MSRRALLVPDCGAGVGLGHLERMLALADALRPDVVAVVAVPVGDAGVRERVRGRGHAAVEVAGDAPARALAAAALVPSAPVVLDGYGFDPITQARLRAGAPLVVVDDLGQPCDCDLAVNPAPGGESLRPRGAGDFLGGPAYALLPAAVVSARDATAADRRAPRTVLLSTGATDPGGLVAAVAAALIGGDPAVVVVAVVGPEMRREDLPDDARVEVLLRPPSLAEPLARATVFAGAAGTSAVQAACAGLPAVVVPVAANQAPQAAALAAVGCAQLATADTVATETLHLLDDAPRREAMAAAGRALVDGRGAERVAAAVRRLAGAPAAR